MAKDPTERALSLLSLLSSRAAWTGPELAERLGVTERTVRRDVDRLRTLDYQVDSTGGTAGGYRLRSGAVIPPLFLDEEETIAIVTALIVAVGNQTTGMVDGSTRALGKLHHVLPARLMRSAAALEEVAQAVGVNTAPQVDPTFVAALAEACRNGLGVRFGYRSRGGDATDRRVEPVSIVTVRSVWYLIGFDLDRDDWRVFRIDRMAAVTVTGHGARQRTVPGGDPVNFLTRSLASAPYDNTADLSFGMPAGELRWLAPWVNEARVEAHGDGTCTVHFGSDSIDDLIGEVIRIVDAADVTAFGGSAAVIERMTTLVRRLREVTDSTTGEVTVEVTGEVTGG